ncbi:MAG: diacylglycerol kinase family protein [Actinomycetota bacterium]
MTRTVLVVNRSSGKSDPDVVTEVRAELAGLGEVELCAPESFDGFADDVLAAASRAGLLVVAGGDGTMNCVLDAVAGRLDDLVLGLVPMGTGNDLARTLELPTDPVEAARALVEGEVAEVDLGRACGAGVERLFLNACMGGFPVEANEAIDGDLKRRLGPLAFWVGGARAVAELTRSTVRMNDVELDGCVAAGVGNGKTCGGGMTIWPDAEPDDGLLDGCALGAPNAAAAVRLAAKVKSGTHEELDSVRRERAGAIRIDSSPAMEFNVDGELLGLTTPATFELVGKVRMRSRRS